MKSKKTNKLSLDDYKSLAIHMEALEDLDEFDKASYINNLAKKSSRLADELESLLPSIQKLSRFLEAPPNIQPEKTVKSIGEYEILNEIGQGGFATVYLARYKPLDRLVALKVSTKTAEEGRTLARLEHENIVRVFDEESDVVSGLHWVSMEYIAGTTLDILLANLENKKTSGNGILEILSVFQKDFATTNPGHFKYRERFSQYSYEEAFLSMGIRLADALVLAHSRGILHLDIKPGNVLINICGMPYLSDFNTSLDSVKQKEGSVSRFGGTVGYMAPEQKAVFETSDKIGKIRKLDGRADVYSLGMVLKEILRSINDSKVIRTIEKATDPDIEKRFRNAEDFRRALESCLQKKLFLKEIRKDTLRNKWSLRHPLLAMTLLGSLPQLLASVLGTFYNKYYVIAYLSSSQQFAFNKMNETATPFLFALGGIFWAYLTIRLSKRMKRTNQWDTVSLHKIRKNAFNLPKWGALINTVSWGGAYLIFLNALHWQSGPLEPKLLFHLSASFFVSWLISFSYTSLFQYYILFKDLCPRFLDLIPESWNLKNEEVTDYNHWIRLSVTLVILIPNLATILLVMNLTNDIPADFLQAVRLLSIALLSTSILGLLVALSIAERLNKTITALKAST